jgi:hypothetical protein
MAQAIRAILLAKETAASLRGRRLSNSNNQGVQGVALRLPGLATRITAVAPTTSKRRSPSLPARLIPPSRWLPPLECSRGVNPSQTARCRPERNCVGSTRKAKLSAVIGPTAGSPRAGG